MKGWIKLHRELMEKPIWLESTPEQKVILVTLLMMANHEGKQWEFAGEKYEAEPGQFVTSLESIAKNTGKGISIQNVRTALKRFEKYEFLTNKSTNRNRLITIVNWGLYQQEESDGTSKLTSNQQATNKQLTTNKNVKNVRMKEIDIIPFSKIVNYLNEKTGKNFRDTTRKTRDLIRARWNEGFREDDFYKVIDVCCSKWKGQTFTNGAKGDDYLQPSTLFNNKFEERLHWTQEQKNRKVADF